MRTATGILCVILLASLRAAPQAKTAIAADKKAFSSAVNLPDPQKRLEALRSFLIQYPKSSRANRANNLILETLAKNFPDLTPEINRQLNLMLKRAHGDSRIDDYDTVAYTLGDAGVLLPRAEKIERKAQQLLRPEEFMAAARKSYADAKLPPPGDAILERYLKAERSGLAGDMGLIYFKEGKTKEALVSLRQAYSDDPDNASASALLGMLAAKDGRKEEAFSYLTRARLTGKLSNDQEAQLESLYKDTHAGSSMGLDDYLDSQYAVIFPPSFEVPKYQPADKSSGRVVLAELFTGSGCGPCAGADLAMDADLERYDRDQLAVLALDQHIPEPDPLANPASVKRFGFYEAGGTPTMAVDGKTEIVGADRAGAKQRFEDNNKLFDKALLSAAEASIQLTARRDADRIEVHASAADVSSDSKNLRLQIALVEDRIRYSGENGIRFHPMVVRGMAGDDGFPVEPGKASSVDYIFDIPKISSELKTYLDNYEKSNDRYGPITFIQKMYAINPADLSIVAFVQDTATKHVLQAAYARVVSTQ